MPKTKKSKKKKGPLEKIQDKLAGIIDYKSILTHLKIEPADIPEMISILAFALLIKQGIEWSEDIVVNFPNIFWLYVDPAELAEAMDQPQVEIIQWIYSFGLSYIFVKNAGAIISGGMSILSFARTMLPI